MGTFTAAVATNTHPVNSTEATVPVPVAAHVPTIVPAAVVPVTRAASVFTTAQLPLQTADIEQGSAYAESQPEGSECERSVLGMGTLYTFMLFWFVGSIVLIVSGAQSGDNTNLAWGCILIIVFVCSLFGQALENRGQ